MSEQGSDPELNAIQIILSALEPLDDEARQRVFNYVLQRTKLSAVTNFSNITDSLDAKSNLSNAQPEAIQSSVATITDVRTLKNQKNPRSANEMAALIGYYLAELAPVDERKSSIDRSDIEKYFKQAGFALPKIAKQTLINAARAGYLDSAGDGKYKLNPVGYNLVVHGLPSKQKE